MKRVFCAIFETTEKIDIHAFCINTENVGVIKNILARFFKQNYKINYKVEAEFVMTFHLNQNISHERLKSYGELLFEKLKEYHYEESPIDISIDLKNVFKTKISLPRLSGKALQASYIKEKNRQFGNMLDNYIEVVNKEVNNSKGYDFKLLLFNNTSYKNIIDIFQFGKLKVDKCAYLPSTLSNIPSSPLSKNLCIIMGNECSYLFITKKYKLKEYRVIPIGYNNIVDSIIEKYGIERNDVSRFCHENIGRLPLKRVVYHAIRRIFDEVSILLLCDNENNQSDYSSIVDKIYIHTLSGMVEDIVSVFPLKMRKIFEIYKSEKKNKYIIYADAFYNNQNYFNYLPLKVKHEKK